ncbi:MAG: hypothetical protein EOO07_26320 [Chitinophagaceae bacterium]|nr:MAG: hypothetical protein EOO07_26320 [Chitinophagaceae bacterium]
MSFSTFATMRTGLIIADFEMRFTTSFRHAAEVRYNVKFINSNLKHIREQLTKLKENIRSGNHNGKHVGYDPTSEDVEHIENLVIELTKRYNERLALTAHPNPKIYTLIHQLREAETQTPKEIVKEGLTELISPPEAEKGNSKENFDASVRAKSLERAINHLTKIDKKKAKK